MREVQKALGDLRLFFSPLVRISLIPLWFSDAVCAQVSPIVAADLCDKLLEACARLAEADLAVQVAQSMRGLGIPVGYVAHGCVLRALCLAGAHEVCDVALACGPCDALHGVNAWQSFWRLTTAGKDISPMYHRLYTTASCSA